MPETDISKMKVADLKRELKLRGLTSTGNKTELQDRLQTALIEGDISLDDTAVLGGDLSDEEENKLLVDENELLKSPICTPVEDPLFDLPVNFASKDELTVKSSPTNEPTKHTVIKRSATQKIKLVSDTVSSSSTTEAHTLETPAESSYAKPTTRKPIVVSGADKATVEGGNKTVTGLSAEERLKLRAKRFGVQPNSNPPLKGAANVNKNSGASILSNKGDKDTEEKQLEALKRRAERFGCVISEKLSKQHSDEKLSKRKERFGDTQANTNTVNIKASDGAKQDVWTKRAMARLERFKSATVGANANN